MTAFLPPNLLALFAARDPIPYLPPADKLGFEKKRHSFGGVSQYLCNFEDPKDTPPPTRVETKDERKERKRKERAEQIAYKLEQDLALWDPHSQSTTDPFKSLFVARVNYDTSESKLRREFEVYGPVRKIKLIHDKSSGRPRGYAFIEYEHERDMHSAYKHADGKKIDGRRVLVDVERGRTVKGWRPRRLGGGLGGTRKGGPDENTRFSGRDEFGARENYRDRERSGTRERERGVERERGERGERRRRTRSRERERRRSRSRDRRRSRSKDKKRDAVRDEDEDSRRKRSRRSRSRDRGDRGDRSDRDKKRSRSRERKRRRSRSKDRKRDRRGEEDISREDEGPEEGGYGDAESEEYPMIKQEPPSDDYENGHANVSIKEEPEYDGYGDEEVPEN